MKFNKILMATLLLLAILSIGAVSASDSDDSSYLSSDDINILADDLDDDWDDDDLDDDWDDDLDDDDDWDDDVDDDLVDDWDDDLDDDLDDDWDDGYEVDDEYLDGSPYIFSDVDEYGIVYYTDYNVAIAYLDNLPSTAIGTLSIYEAESLIATANVVNGTASLKLSDLINGLVFPLVDDHYFEVLYKDGENTYQKEIDISVIDYKIIPQSDTIYLGQNAVFTVTLSNTVKGYVEVYEDDELLGSFEARDGVAIVTLSDLTLGTHYFDFMFECGDYGFNDFSQVVVAPKKITTVSTSYIGADNFFSVTLPNDAKGSITVKLKNLKTGKSKKIEVKYTNGKAVIPASMLGTGNYAIIDFDIVDNVYGDYSFVDLPSYKEGDVYATFKVAYPKFTLNKIATLKKSKNSVTLKATLGKANGKYLAKKLITFKFHTKTYKVYTDSKGVAKVTIKKAVYKNYPKNKWVAYQATYFGKTIKYKLQMKN